MIKLGLLSLEMATRSVFPIICGILYKLLQNIGYVREREREKRAIFTAKLVRVCKVLMGKISL